MINCWMLSLLLLPSNREDRSVEQLLSYKLMYALLALMPACCMPCCNSSVSRLHTRTRTPDSSVEANFIERRQAFHASVKASSRQLAKHKFQAQASFIFWVLKHPNLASKIPKFVLYTLDQQKRTPYCSRKLLTS